MPGKQKRPLVGYIDEYIKSENAQKIINSSDIVNEEGFDSWSFKKLIFLHYYIEPFLKILISKGFNCYFVDLYSGSGANVLSGTDTKTIGSPIVSLLKGILNPKSGDKKRFNKWFFVESSDKLSEALEKRASASIKILKKDFNEKLVLGKDVVVLRGDCEDRVDDVISQIEKDCGGNNAAILVFVDPFALSHFRWKTLEKLSKFGHIDVIFTLPTNSYERNKANYKEFERYVPRLSEEDKRKIMKGEIDQKSLADIYAEGIANVIKTRIYYYNDAAIAKNRVNREIYRITLFTRSSAGAKIVEELIDRLNGMKTRDIDMEVRKIIGEISSLDNFM